MRSSFIMAATLVAAAGAASAADLQNRDGTAYEIRVRSGASTTHSSIEGGTRRLQLCSDCTVEVVGVGEAVVDASVTVVIIENGELRTE